jgi:hypothetical protein
MLDFELSPWAVQVSFTLRKGLPTLGGLVGAEFDNKIGEEEEVEAFAAVSLDKLLQDLSAPRVIDYLSLDIEGAEAWVFDLFPWDHFTFLTMTIERPKERLRQVGRKVSWCDVGYIVIPCECGGSQGVFWFCLLSKRLSSRCFSSR